MLFGTKDPSERNRNHKVIIINRFYWPDQSATAQLSTDLAEHLAKQGMPVVVVTSRRHYDDAAVTLSGRAKHHGVCIRRVSTFPGNGDSLASRMLNFISFYVMAFVALIRLLHRDDTIIVKSDPPLFAIIPWIITSFRRATVINWCQDLYPEIAAKLGIRWAQGPIGTALLALRNRSLRQADMTVVISASMRTHLIGEGVAARKIHLIQNWCDHRISPLERNKNSLRQAWNLADHFVIAYSGNLGRAHLARDIFALVDSLSDLAHLKMLFIGSGSGMDWLDAQCQRHGHHHVLFKPYQPRNELSMSLSLADLHLISLNPSCQSYIYPSKYYGILAAGRPIAYLGDPGAELALEISAEDLGLVLDLHQKDRWKDQITQIHQDHARWSRQGLNARLLYERSYETSHALSQWQHLIEHREAMKSETFWKRAA